MGLPFRALVVVACGAVAGCASEADVADSASALGTDVVLDRRACATVDLTNRAQAAGVFDGDLKGCVIASGTQTGADLITKAQELLSEKRALSDVPKRPGEKAFSSFKPRGGVGDLRQGGEQSFDADVTLNVTGPDASGTLSFVTKRAADGSLSLTMRNTTRITGAFGVTLMEPDGLAIEIVLTPAINGLVVTGTVDVKLASFKSKSEKVSRIGVQIVDWLNVKLGSP